MTTVFSPVHVQVSTSRPGVLVDEGIRDLLEALWAANFGTEFSCEGRIKGYICFSTVEDAVRFVEATPFVGLCRVGRFVDVRSDSLRYLARIWGAA